MFTAYKHDYIENNASPFFSLLFYIDVFYVINKAVSMLSMQFLCILQRATVLQNPGGGGHSGTEGGRTLVTYFAEEGVFFEDIRMSAIL